MMFDNLKNHYSNLNTLKLIYGNELVNSFLSLKNVNKVSDLPPTDGKILVLATYPADEIVGLGGTLSLHIKQKDQVKIIYIADGSSGFPNNYRPTAKEKQEMADRRELEARNSMELIGINDMTFLGYKDGNFNVNENIKKYMIQTLENFKPDIVYVPYFFDTSTDRKRVLSLLVHSISKMSVKPKVAMYEVWEPLRANFFVCIDKVVSSKEEALKMHKSQLGSINYLYSAMGLSAYRGAVNEAGDYAEAFLVIDGEVFLKLHEKISRLDN